MRARRAAIAMLAVVAVGSALPIWTAIYAGPLEISGEPAPLWTALAHIPDTPGHPSVWEWHGWNIILGALMFTCAGLAGWAVYRRRPETLFAESSDYAEGSNGSVPDGRR